LNDSDKPPRHTMEVLFLQTGSLSLNGHCFRPSIIEH